MQYAALTAIQKFPDLDTTRLSNLIALDRSTLGNVVERLDGKGWIERRTSAEDRRAKSLRITAAGKAVLKAVEPAVTRAQIRMLSPIDEHQRADFLRCLATLVQLNNEHSWAPAKSLDDVVRKSRRRRV